MSVLAENEGFTLGKFDRIKVAVEGGSVFKLSHMVIQSMSNMWVLVENEGFTLGKFDRIKVAVEGGVSL